MATPTYDLLDSTTLTSTATSVTFSSIDQSYRDLVLVVSGIAQNGFVFAHLRFNGDSGGNYYAVRMEGNGTSATSGTTSGATTLQISAQGLMSDTKGGLAVFQIMDYTATDKHKSVLGRYNRDEVRTTAGAARWANTSAITSIEVLSVANTYSIGQTFYLYGIAS